MNSALFSSNRSFTFDDVLIVPGFVEILSNKTDVSVQLTSEIN